MNEGGMIKMYVEKEHIDKAELATTLGVAEPELEQVYASQTIDPEIKKKLQQFFQKNIFDGTMLMEYRMHVPDQQANKDQH